jgi:serine phosphatase RsbU (regulator of sigma subunit)
MRQFLLLVQLLLITQIAFAQRLSSKEDSLLHVVDNVKDAEKISIFIELSDLRIYEEDGLIYANKAYNLAKSTKNRQAEAEALNTIGRFYVIHYEETKALEYFFNSLSIAESVDNKQLNGKILRNIGQAYYYLDSLEKSKLYSLKTLDLSIKNKDKLLEADALIDLGVLLHRNSKSDSALIYMKQALEIRLEKKALLDAALAYSRIGKVYFEMGLYLKSIENYLKEIELKEALNDSGLPIAYYNLGRIHRTIGNYQLALEQYQKSLSIFEKLRNTSYIARVSSEIGLVYENLSRSSLAVQENESNFRKALEFHKAALAIYEDENNLPQIAQSLNNIANNHSRLAINTFVKQYGELWEDSLISLSSSVIQATFGSTFDYYNRALAIFQQINDEREIAAVNINLGSHHIYTRNWALSLEHLNKGIRLARELNSMHQVSIALFHLGESYFRQANLDLAEQNLLQSVKISEELGIKDMMMHNNQKLSKVYEKKGNLSKALKHFNVYNLIKDDLFSEQSQKVITEMQTKYETEKKEQEIKLLNNERALQHSVIQRQRLTLAITIGGLLVIIAFAGLLINMVRQKQRANKILEEKNELISHQKQEITDSIRYASRIQNAVLPSPVILSEALKEHFVLFLPRDIVSGDFYWFTKQQNKMILVAADCTGHGVPGAFMSMLGVSFLYEIVNKEGVMEPARILNMLREFVKLTLSQTGKKDEQKDGMDISLCMLDIESMRLEWAGAYNPLILIRDGEIIEYKANKMPVAIHITDHQPFTNHEIDLQSNDRFYMFSDGFPDQFGGEDGRKFMSKRFKQLLLDIHQKPMAEQREILHAEHLSWRGNHEQIDDIVVFGVRV